MNLIDLALKKGLIESADRHGAAVLTNMVQEKGTAIRLAESCERSPVESDLSDAVSINGPKLSRVSR